MRYKRLYNVRPPNHVKRTMTRLFAVSVVKGKRGTVVDSQNSKSKIIVVSVQFAFGKGRPGGTFTTGTTGQMRVPLEIELTWILWRKTGDKDWFIGVKVGLTTYKLDQGNDVSVPW